MQFREEFLRRLTPLLSLVRYDVAAGGARTFRRENAKTLKGNIVADEEINDTFVNRLGGKTDLVPLWRNLCTLRGLGKDSVHMSRYVALVAWRAELRNC
jgi:hypothetical protein